jgi:hypothetical protein
MGLPALVLSKSHLRETLLAAGPEATLELPNVGEVDIDALEDLSSEALLGSKISAPGVSLSFGATAMSTLLTFDDTDEASSLAESLLETLAPHRRRGAAFTHGDGSIVLGLLLPLSAGLLAPESSTKLACALAAALWMVYLWWVQRNATRKWCQFI